MLDDVLRNIFLLQLLNAFSNCKSIWLWKEIGHQLIVVAHGLAFNLERSLRFSESNELGWDHSSLVKELEETVLSVCSWFSKIDNCRFILNLLSSDVDSLSIAFHIKLLNVRGKFRQSLTIRNNCSCRIFFDCGSIKSNQTQKQRKIFLH